MPRYNYECPACGGFDAMRPVEAYAEPCPCPACGAAAPRGLASARIATGAAPGAAIPARGGGHRAGCGCCTPALGRAMRAEAVAAGAPRRGPAPAAGSFLTRDS